MVKLSTVTVTTLNKGLLDVSNNLPLTLILLLTVKMPVRVSLPPTVKLPVTVSLLPTVKPPVIVSLPPTVKLLPISAPPSPPTLNFVVLLPSLHVIKSPL